MITPQQLFFYVMVVVVCSAVCHWIGISAEQYESEGSLSNLYDILLQREYAGPSALSSYRFERKAQRSPSLRLRFGRSDQSTFPLLTADKRWFGDVNQKPIRSPSLRLRFGRRSDPSMPQEHFMDDDIFVDDNIDFENLGSAGLFDRPIRKQPRLRWGRSIPFEADETNYAYDDNESEPYSRTNDLVDAFMKNVKIRNLLEAVRKVNENQENLDEFERENRKPATLRLRWGRSTGFGQINNQQLQQQEQQHERQSETKTEIISNNHQNDDVPANDKA